MFDVRPLITESTHATYLPLYREWQKQENLINIILITVIRESLRIPFDILKPMGIRQTEENK